MSKIELDPSWLEEFDNVCHTYRAWPATDPAGTRSRFEELVEYVRSYATQEVAKERDRCAKLVESAHAVFVIEGGYVREDLSALIDIIRNGAE